jgi:hypothetical protein
MSSANTTVDHDEIKTWAESRGGRPSIVPTSGGKGKRKPGGILRLDFGPKEEKFEETTWDEFFKIFDESELAFLYQDKTANGKQSRFNKFVHKDADPASHPKPRQSSGSASGTTKAALMEKARAQNVPGRSRMSKDELEKAVA